MRDFQPVGSALPPRRGQLIEARAAGAARMSGESIIVPEARDRMLEFFEREWVPAEAKNALGTAIFGDLRAQQPLFQAMIDTWPRLQKSLREIKLAVRMAPWKAEPWSERGESPTAEAEKLAGELERAIWGMRTDPVRHQRGFEGLLEALTEGYWIGHQVVEPRWERGEDGTWRPVSVKVVPPRFYAYPATEDGEDRLMLDPTGGLGGQIDLEDFDTGRNRHRFLVAVNSSHTGHPSVGAPLRALTPYWMAAVYGLRWAMVYSQLFGIPFRWANYADDADKDAVSEMLEKVGTAGWAAFKGDTALNLIEPSKGSDQLPQWKLVEMADEQCDVFVLGQTLTSSQGDSGSRALGEVHEVVRKGVIGGVCDFIGEILSHQLVPAYVAFNYGRERRDLPGLWARFEDPKDEKALAERDEVLRRAFPELEWSLEQIRERHGLAVPVDETDRYQSASEPAGDEGDDEKSRKLDGADAPAAAPMTADKLSAAVLEGLTGVSRDWLRPVRPFFDRLAALAMSKQVTDEDFLAALERAQRAMPELFERLNSEVLQEAFEEVIGSAVLAGSVSRYEG